MKVTPLFKRYLVFHMPVRPKIVGSKLYVGNSVRGSMDRAEEIWIIEKGKNCAYDLSRGDHCWLYDGFELTDCKLDLWEEYKDEAPFKRLKQMAEECDGEVKTKLVLEDSILAVDPEYQIESYARGILWTG